MAASRGLPRLTGMTPSSTRYPVQRVEIGFAGRPPVRQIGRASGVSDVEIDGQIVRCLVTGSFQPLLEALHGHEVITLSSIRVEGGH
jgi:hypothetical protein